MTEERQKPQEQQRPTTATADAPQQAMEKPKEIGGPKGLEPTRYGDWEKAGRCIDF